MRFKKIPEKRERHAWGETDFGIFLPLFLIFLSEIFCLHVLNFKDLWTPILWTFFSKKRQKKSKKKLTNHKTGSAVNFTRNKKPWLSFRWAFHTFCIIYSPFHFYFSFSDSHLEHNHKSTSQIDLPKLSILTHLPDMYFSLFPSIFLFSQKYPRKKTWIS